MRRITACATMMIALGSCTIGYAVDVLMRGNQVVFRFARSGWFGGHEPAPVQHLWVRRVSANEQVVWQLDSLDQNGRDLGEVIYGSSPSRMTQITKAEPLGLGQVYSVELLALGGGGSRQFAILPGPGPAQPITALQQ